MAKTKASKGKSAKSGKSAKAAKPAKPAKAPKPTKPVTAAKPAKPAAAAKGRGEIYTRADGKFAFRVRAANGQIVASSQGYVAKADARSTLSTLLSGGYAGPVTEV